MIVLHVAFQTPGELKKAQLPITLTMRICHLNISILIGDKLSCGLGKSEEGEKWEGSMAEKQVQDQKMKWYFPSLSLWGFNHWTLDLA